MANYMLLGQGGFDAWTIVTPEQVQEMYRQFFAWSDKLQKDGVMRGGNELQRNGRILERNGQPPPSIFDG